MTEYLVKEGALEYSGDSYIQREAITYNSGVLKFDILSPDKHKTGPRHGGIDTSLRTPSWLFGTGASKT